jgi:hypothetical protein
MQAGVAAADMTPPLGLVLQGHYGGKPSHAVLHPIEARAIALRADKTAVVIVTLDVIGIERDTTAAIRSEVARRVGDQPVHVMVAASHTHSAPATLPNLGLTPDPSFMKTLVDRAAGCAVEALKKVEPVTIGFGCGSAHFNINRRPLPGTTSMYPNAAGIVDRRVRVLRVDKADGAPLAVLFHYSCHPTALRGADGAISSDFPGAARAMIESELGCPALFLPGCFGNIRPNLVTAKGTFRSATPEQLEELGRELSRAVCATARATMTGETSSLKAGESDVTLPFAAPPSTDELTKLAETGGDALVRAWAKQMLSRTDELPESESSMMQAVQIGPLAIVSIPGEPVQEIGHDIERRLRDHVLDTWPIGYTNDMLGYLCTERMKTEGGYEPTAYPYFNRAAGFGNEATILAETAERLVRTGVAP